MRICFHPIIASTLFFVITHLSSFSQAKVNTYLNGKAQIADSLLLTIDRLHDKANTVEDLAEKGYNLEPIKQSLPQITNDIHLIKSTLKNNVQVMDIKSLQTFWSLLDQSHNQLNEYRNLLLGYNRQLVTMQTEIAELHKNKLLASYKNDSLFIKLYNNELSSIEKSWSKAQGLTDKNLMAISKLQQQVTGYYYESGDLQKELKGQMLDYSSRITGNEYPYIWQSYENRLNQQALDFLNVSFTSQQELIKKYLQDNVVYHIFLAILIIASFSYWTIKNRRKLILQGKPEEWSQFIKGGVLSRRPFLQSLILVFNLAPFFDLSPPEAYIGMLQVVIFIVISIFIVNNWPKLDKLFWLKLSLAYIVFLLINNIVNPGSIVRLVLVGINLFLIFNARYLVNKNKKDLGLTGFANTVSYIFLILNILSILLNVSGRMTLAKMLTNAALVGYVQIVALSVFKNIVKTAFLLQVHTASVENNGASLINYDRLNSSISKLLSIVVIGLWMMVFFTNLNIYNAITNGLGALLFKPRIIGNTPFTIGNILLFFLVIYLSSLAQKYVGYIFGENQGITVPGERKGSKVVMTKLIVILIGFLLAILVSGLPIDKITVILGAFGVGIGLGLQNIVNNFVSGIILIFERPLQVGDYVEVSGYKGWVNDIGIRATRLSSSEGAEILVPNGTILSGNLVNWTLSNAQIRLELNMKIEPQSLVEQAKILIMEILENEEDVISTRRPEIFNQSVNGNTAEIKVWFWIAQVSRQQMVRSKLITQIHSVLEQHEIKIV